MRCLSEIAGMEFAPVSWILPHFAGPSVTMFNIYPKTLFRDREDAGEKLASLLAPDYKNKNALVLGIPRGGVAVAYYVALGLNASLSVLVSKKLTYPGNEEYGFGAISEEDYFYVAPGEGTMISGDDLLQVIARQRSEIQRRVQKFRNGTPLPSMKGRIVIIVDDGIATGVTLIPAIRLCRKKEAARVVVAAPVSGKNFDGHLLEADEVRILHQPSPFYGVGQAYSDFRQLTDEEVLVYLQKASQENPAKQK